MVSQTPDRTIFTGSRVPPAWASVTTPGGCPSQRPAGFSRGAVSTFEGERKHSRKRSLRMALQLEESNELVDARGVPDAFRRPVPPSSWTFGISGAPGALFLRISGMPRRGPPEVTRRRPGAARGAPPAVRPRGHRGGELRHLIPEPWGGGGLPGQAGAVRPHPPADSRHLSGMKLDITHRPRSHDGALLAPP